MNTHAFTAPQVIEERNKLLMAWLADELKLEGSRRQQLAQEMALLFAHATDNELAEYLWEKLCSKGVVKDVESAKSAMKRFHDIAHGWLSNTSIPDYRN